MSNYQRNIDSFIDKLQAGEEKQRFEAIKGNLNAMDCAKSIIKSTFAGAPNDRAIEANIANVGISFDDYVKESGIPHNAWIDKSDPLIPKLYNSQKFEIASEDDFSAATDLLVRATLYANGCEEALSKKSVSHFKRADQNSNCAPDAELFISILDKNCRDVDSLIQSTNYAAITALRKELVREEIANLKACPAGEKASALDFMASILISGAIEHQVGRSASRKSSVKHGLQIIKDQLESVASSEWYELFRVTFSDNGQFFVNRLMNQPNSVIDAIQKIREEQSELLVESAKIQSHGPEDKSQSRAVGDE